MKNAKKSNLTSASDAMAKKKLENEERINRKVNEEIFPQLKEISESVEDAKMICQVTKIVIQQAIVNLTMGMLLKDLEIEKELTGCDSKEIIKYNKMIEMLSNEKIFDIYKILDGIDGEIQGGERMLMKRTKLNELYADKA